MDWNQYKPKVTGSREVIVFPFFQKHISAKSGIGIDIGCGDGDLASYLVESTKVSFVGVDVDCNNLTIARTSDNQCRLHFVQGDIEKNCIPNIGILCDFAISNCCFSHISDQGVYAVFTDIRSILKSCGDFIFILPSIDWAREQYSDVVHVHNGITALPRYGERQFFRLPEWYSLRLIDAALRILSMKLLTFQMIYGLN